jgi:ABC-type amino acid transport substrate-binding protein
LAIAALAAACLTGCQPESLPPPAQDKKLVVAGRPGPTSWYPGPDGQPAGFDHDLLARFADEQKLKLEVVEVGSAAALLAKVAAGDCQEIVLQHGGELLVASRRLLRRRERPGTSAHALGG